MLTKLKAAGFNVLAMHHAGAILTQDLPGAEAEIETALLGLQIPIEEVVSGGGGEAPFTQRLRKELTELGWPKRNITVTKLVNDGDRSVETQSLSHEIDHVKRFGEHYALLEIEWNNKDPFFDRDLENFQRLHAEGMASIGIIITRGDSLQANLKKLLGQFIQREGITDLSGLEKYDYNPTNRQRNMINTRELRSGSFEQAWVDVFTSDKYGEATTHWRKLEDRVSRGVGNPCPLLLIGIPDGVIKV
ncbi:MAG: restriction endonuclease [Henriciella sp.]|nr:restriction endonuclease [Henriciella sp.]